MVGAIFPSLCLWDLFLGPSSGEEESEELFFPLKRSRQKGKREREREQPQVYVPACIWAPQKTCLLLMANYNIGKAKNSVKYTLLSNMTV